MKKITKIMIELDGEKAINITDLEKDQYEDFLKIMHSLRIAYISTTDRSIQNKNT